MHFINSAGNKLVKMRSKPYIQWNPGRVKLHDLRNDTKQCITVAIPEHLFTFNVFFRQTGR